MQIYEVSLSRIEKMESLISKFIKKWLGVPKSLTNVALYSSSTKLKLPTKSLAEEFKLGKAWLFQMLRDPLEKSAQPAWPTGEKCTTCHNNRSKMERETCSGDDRIFPQNERSNRLCGNWENRIWSSPTKVVVERDHKRRLVSEEIHSFEESKRLAIAVTQPKQGAWTRWENTKDRTITWSVIKQMEPKQLGFLIKAVYDILPTPVNLKLVGLSTSNLCKACGKIANLKHVLTGCQYSLRSYTWIHNEIFGIIAEIAKMCCETANEISCIKTNIQFVKEGNVSKTPHGNNRYKPTLLDGCTDWRVIADVDRQLAFPTEITSTRQRPDLVIWSVNSKKGYHCRINDLFRDQHRLGASAEIGKYEDLREQCTKNDWSTDLFPLEIRCRGFISNATITFLTKIGLSPAKKREYIKTIQNKAATASERIWHSYRLNTIQ